MIKFTTIIQQFNEQGEKTGWTYITIPTDIAQQLKPGNKKSFRVKGKLDTHPISGVSLMPMGEGNFIMAINASMRKGIKKRKGAQLIVQLEVDDKLPELSKDLLECLEDEPAALEHFNSLTRGHRKYFSDWILSAKTEPTKTKRLAQAVDALSKKFDFGMMLRKLKDERKDLLM